MGSAENQFAAKPSNVRSFSNGLIIEDLAIGKPDGKRATPGSKVTFLKNNYAHWSVRQSSGSVTASFSGVFFPRGVAFCLFTPISSLRCCLLKSVGIVMRYLLVCVCVCACACACVFGMSGMYVYAVNNS